MTALETPVGPVPEAPEHVSLLRRAARESGYLLLGLPLGIAGLVVFVVGIALGAGLLVTLLGLPILAGMLAAAQGLGNAERGRLAALGYPVPATLPFHTQKKGLRRFLARLGHGQSWLDLLHALLSFPVSLATFIVTVVWWVAGAGGVLYIVWERYLPDGDRDGLADLLGYPGRVPDIVLTTVLGAVLLLTAPWVVHGMVALHRGLARVTLGATSSSALRAQVAELTRSRAAVVGAEADTLRRIERDIHDGPQQRLVRMSMDLQSAQRRLAADDRDAAEQLIAEAIGHAQASLDELRTLSRGIAPPVLSDRGLRAAIGSAAGQSLIPVELNIGLEPGQRLAAARESAAYFVVTESLVNAAKHSGATAVRVTVAQLDDGALQVEIADDGIGGAHPGKGHGLTGLADRLAGVDGVLEVHSPAGAGTRVVATIP